MEDVRRDDVKRILEQLEKHLVAVTQNYKNVGWEIQLPDFDLYKTSKSVRWSDGKSRPRVDGVRVFRKVGTKNDVLFRQTWSRSKKSYANHLEEQAFNAIEALEFAAQFRQSLAVEQLEHTLDVISREFNEELV